MNSIYLHLRAANPLPEPFLIQSVDNDIRCDGTDPDNYAPFAATLTQVVRKISSAAPKARILLVSSPPGTTTNYAQVVSKIPSLRSANSGDGPCDLFSQSGKPVPPHWRYLDRVTQHYLDEVASVCKKFATCQYDNGALYHMTLTPDDLSPDGNHLTITGLRKQAALEWRVLGLGS